MASQSAEPPRLEKITSPHSLGARLRGWWTPIGLLLAMLAVAGFAFLTRGTIREPAPAVGSVHIASVPTGADVTFDGTLLSDRTPLTIDGAPVGTRHKIVISMRHYQPYTEEIAIPRSGSPIQVVGQLTSQTGKIAINSRPAGAQIWINGQPRGTTPATVVGIDIDATSTIELLHKDFGKRAVPLRWDTGGIAYVDYTFEH